MSIKLNPASLSGLIVGQTASIDLTQATGPGGVPQTLVGTPGPTVRLHNESSSGVFCTMTSGQSFDLPAGGWQDCYPTQGDTAITFTVVYVMPNAQVALVLATYYYPGQPVPPMTALGNSSVGIGGVVNTVGNMVATAVQNNGNAAGTNILAAQVVGDAFNALTLTNDADLELGAGTRPGRLNINGTGSTLNVHGSTTLDNGNISTDGAGTFTALALKALGTGGISLNAGTLHLVRGSVSQLSLFSGSGPATGVTHGCSVSPNVIIIFYNASGGNFGSPPTAIPYAYSYAATTCSVSAQSGYNWFGVAIVI